MRSPQIMTHSGLHRLSRRRRRDGRAVEDDVAADLVRESEQSLSDQFLTRAAKSDQSHDLAASEIACDRSRALNREVGKRQKRAADRCGWSAKDLRRLAADDLDDETLGRDGVNAAPSDDAPIPQHHDEIGDPKHFVETMGYVDDCNPCAAKPLDCIEQSRDLVRRQARRGLVHHDDVGVRSQRAADRDQRLLGPCQLLDARVRIDDYAQLVEGLLRAPPHRPHPDKPRAAWIAEREADVLRHGHPVDQAQVLVNEGDRKVRWRRF